MANEPKDNKKFISLLNDTYDWPAEYTFKFIVPNDKYPQLVTLFVDCQASSKPSRTGKYISVTIKKTVASAEEVIRMYMRVAVIDGVISL